MYFLKWKHSQKIHHFYSVKFKNFPVTIREYDQFTSTCFTRSCFTIPVLVCKSSAVHILQQAFFTLFSISRNCVFSMTTQWQKRFTSPVVIERFLESHFAPTVRNCRVLNWTHYGLTKSVAVVVEKVDEWQKVFVYFYFNQEWDFDLRRSFNPQLISCKHGLNLLCSELKLNPDSRKIPLAIT